MNIGEKVRACRLSNGLTQEELALKVGYKGKSMICRIETGRNNPSYDLLCRIATALSVSVGSLLGEDASILERVAAENGMKEAYDLLQQAKMAGPQPADNLDAVSSELVDLLVRLKSQEAEKVVAYIQGILAAREE